MTVCVCRLTVNKQNKTCSTASDINHYAVIYLHKYIQQRKSETFDNREKENYEFKWFEKQTAVATDAVCVRVCVIVLP